ncbi:septum formation inhibitor Maf [Heliorestis acidaminivorans]|uniref:dTTP/UTP pyrophosphatase n=1 Tax=Heliorestis acidaminivorans TaxID=553427 RepID=A0A6I0F046_9FIRM|nr:Maf family protein [Heliorestis acidaminivorans]KAB2952342.1 septum formation inhibitor Maf [Heliorestis acidaminivorans]
MNLILASASPRRKELLEGLNVSFQVLPSHFDENSAEHISIEKRVLHLALGKAKKVAPQVTDGIVIGADTVVIFNNLILGKPETEQEARQMLESMSGCSHRVITSLALIEVKEGQEVKEISAAEETTVFFRSLNDEVIDWYLATGESYDKAGAYGIQGYGALLVDRIEGDYFNVVGLPLRLLDLLLENLGYTLRR